MLPSRRVRPGRACLVAAAFVLVAAATPRTDQAPTEGRVMLISLDGLGATALTDPAMADALQRLRALAARGVEARGVQPHTPSTTANTHAALWTGAWGDSNGITGNTMPIPPRSAHTVLERAVGFRSDHLRAEPIWVTASRQGVRTVVQQASQSYPFVPAAIGTGPRHPVILNGYQTRALSPARVVRGADVTRVPCESDSAPVSAAACFTWSVGPLQFAGRLVAASNGTSAPMLQISSPQAAATVEATAHETERVAPDGRALARYFSDGLLLDRVPDTGPVMVYFRLFEAAPDATDFVLYQTAIHELALYDGGGDTSALIAQLLREAGGFLGNAGGYQWERPEAPLGRTLAEGGDGTAERRFLESLEIAVRQVIAHARWLWRHYDPGLFVVYTSLPDELDHRLLGLASGDARYVAFRHWGYALVDETVGTLAGLAGPADHVVFVSDHGLAAVTHEVKVAVALERAGLLVLDATGVIDIARSRVVPMRNCLVVNSTDWKDGLVTPAQHEATLAEAFAALRALTDPATGRPVVTEIVSGADAQRRLGFGGPNGADACFGLADGYAIDENALRGDPIVRRRLPKGDHNFLGTRSEMQGILVAAGPRLPRGGRWPHIRAIDVAPLISDLLHISPPANATGRSPLAAPGASGIP